MCNFIGKSNEWIFYKLSKSEILRLHSIVHVAMETTKTSNFTCQLKSFWHQYIFHWQSFSFHATTFSCHELANDIHSKTSKTVFSHLKSARFYSWLRIFIDTSLSIHVFVNKKNCSPFKCLAATGDYRVFTAFIALNYKFKLRLFWVGTKVILLSTPNLLWPKVISIY